MAEYFSRKHIPAWTAQARLLYESGAAMRVIAESVGWSISAIHVYRRLGGWTRTPKIKALPEWHDATRALYEAGAEMSAVLATAGIGDSRLYELARRWGWDAEARWVALWRNRCDGMERAYRTKMRRKAHKHAKKSRRPRTVNLAMLDRVWRDPLCAYCNATLTSATRTIDHVEPLARGGANDARNLTACFISCNASKRDRPLL